MRALLACSLLIVLAGQASAAEVRNFFTPRVDGQRIGACLSGGACGKAAADAFCKAEGFDEAMIFQRERAQSARILDSDRLCDGNCTSFRQVKCYTEKSDLQASKAAL